MGVKLLILTAGISERMTGRIFGLDFQLVVDTCILAVSIFVLFTALSYLLFEPAREFLQKRQNLIESQLENAKREQSMAEEKKAGYEKKLREADFEKETILELARKEAKTKEMLILKEADEKAVEIKMRAEKEAKQTKIKLKEEGKDEMILIAAAMANKIILSSMDIQKQDELFEATLQEMGETTWQNQQ